jgi:hypothetical protein
MFCCHPVGICFCSCRCIGPLIARPERPANVGDASWQETSFERLTPHLRRRHTARRYGQRVLCSSQAQGRTTQSPGKLSEIRSRSRPGSAWRMSLPSSKPQAHPSNGFVSATVILLEETDFAGMNEEWIKWFPTNPPARQGAKLPVRVAGMRVSIAAIAEA